MSARLIVEELRSDPGDRGYSGMDDRAVVAELTRSDITRSRELVAGSEVIEAIDDAELATLQRNARGAVSDLLNLYAETPIYVGQATRDMLDGHFPPGTQTHAALHALYVETISRAHEIGIQGRVRVGWVTDARRVLREEPLRAAAQAAGERFHGEPSGAACEFGDGPGLSHSIPERLGTHLCWGHIQELTQETGKRALTRAALDPDPTAQATSVTPDDLLNEVLAEMRSR